ADNVFNRQSSVDFMVQESGQTDDYLQFVNSSLGSHYYLLETGHAALFPKELDVFFTGRAFEAVDRYLLFRVLSKSDSVRVLLDLTTTIVNSGDRSLPPAQIIGADGVSVGLIGHGAARVISPPVRPLEADGRRYLLLDLGADPQFIDTPKRGAMGLY